MGRLSRERIVAVALAVVAREGVDAVSMRRVAAAFDTGQASLYGHVANKDELVRLMFDEVCRTVPVPAPDPGGTAAPGPGGWAARGPGSWAAALRRLGRDWHAALAAHGDLARAALDAVPTGPHALRLCDAALGLLLAGGLPPAAAAHGLDRFLRLVLADAAAGAPHRIAATAGGVDPDRYAAAFAARLGAYYAELPADRYPHLRAHAAAVAGGDPAGRFAFGLDLLVAGLAARAAPAPVPAGAGQPG